jgi:DNA-binding beta-propeller fold protein YncE
VAISGPEGPHYISRNQNPTYNPAVRTLLTVLVVAIGASVQNSDTATYHIIVASEAADAISHLTFGPAGLTVDRTVSVGLMLNDIDGPHGLAVAPDGQSYFVTFAHGQPNGTLWRLAAGDDRALGHVTLGMFPATAQVTPDGEFAFVVNFNLHGDRVPSSVSVVATGGMLEVARIPTCQMPHGSRINAQGTKHYSACMMDDTLVEIDTRTLKVARHFTVTRGGERGAWGAPPGRPAATHMAHGGHGAEPPPRSSTACSPTWAQPSIDGRRVFVACNGSSEIVEIDAEAWSLVRRVSAGPGVYNLAVTHDGRRLLATNRRGQSVSVIDILTGAELARVPTKRRVVHGVVVTPDDRYAFVSVEGIAAEPGTVEVLDLTSLRVVATADVPAQAGGIDVIVPPSS